MPTEKLSLIGLWIRDEFSFNKQFRDHDHIAQVMWNYNYNSERISLAYNPYPMGATLPRKVLVVRV